MPIGLLIKRMLAKGWSYPEAVEAAYRMAGKPSPYRKPA